MPVSEGGIAQTRSSKAECRKAICKASQTGGSGSAVEEEQVGGTMVSNLEYAC